MKESRRHARSHSRLKAISAVLNRHMCNWLINNKVQLWVRDGGGGQRPGDRRSVCHIVPVGGKIKKNLSKIQSFFFFFKKEVDHLQLCVSSLPPEGSQSTTWNLFSKNLWFASHLWHVLWQRQPCSFFHPATLRTIPLLCRAQPRYYLFMKISRR